jgi:hypothetical protein
MKRLPRLLPCVVLACSLSMPFSQLAFGQAAPPPAGPPPAAPPPAVVPPAEATSQPATTAPPETTAPPASAPAAEPTTAPAAPEVGANQSLADQVDDFWHYGEIGRYDLQAALGGKIVAAGQQNPQDVLKAFEAAAGRHHQPGGAPTDMDLALLRWQAADPQMKTVAAQVIDVLNRGRFERRQDPQFIADNIKRLDQGERAYALAMGQLRASGELAVPQLVSILTSQLPADVQYHDVARRALRDLGRSALSPLWAATDMDPKNPSLTTIAAILGDIGYPASAPYLVALVHDPNSSAEVKDAASLALRKLNVSPDSNPGDLFYDLANRFYYGTASVQPDPRSPKAFIWYWTDRTLTSKAVPPAIFNDLMTMRETEHALRLQPSRPDQSVALWLAGNIRRGIDLPQGETDPTRTPDEPSAHYYNVAQGAQYLNLVLDRSLKDNTPQSSAVALAAIKSLQDIVGQSNMFTGGRGQPLVDAMRYSDRQVRYEAAFAIAAALPQQRFQGQDRVVPLLAEAVSQSGTPGILVVGPQNERARLAAELKGYTTAGGQDPSSAIADSATIPAVDVILMSEDLGSPQIDRVIELASQNPRLERAAKLVIVHTLGSPWVRMSLTDPTLSYTEATAGQPLLDSIEQARKKAGGLPVSPQTATDTALRAANLLARLAISRGQVLDLSAGESQMLAALGDKRPEIVKAVGEAVALINSPRSQGALADRAGDAKNLAEIRIALYKSLATSAKFFGNHLDPNEVNDLQQAVMGEKDLNVRSAAAEARGALNLPAQDVKPLILQRHD